MIDRRLVFFLAFFAVVVSLSAQEKRSVSFVQNTHDFGIIREEDGEVLCVFRFINEGAEAISIKKITASCGCTSPTWSTDAIAPSQQGEFTLGFDPKERYGPFHQGATVFFSALSGDFTESVSIKGMVAFPEKSLEEQYPYSFGGGLLLKNRFLIVGDIYKGEEKVRTIEMFNNGSSSVTVAGYNLPKYLKVESFPQVVPPQEKAVLNITIMSGKMPMWGYVADSVRLLVNGRKSADVVDLKADIKEDFSRLTMQEKVEAPVISLSVKVLDLGELKIGKQAKAFVELKNNGIKPLIIRRIVSENPYLTVTAPSQSLKGGKRARLTVAVDATQLHPFDFRKRVQIISNDPVNSVINLYINWKTVK